MLTVPLQPKTPQLTPGVEEELDLRAEDDALIASELEAALAKREAEAAKADDDDEGAAPGRRRRRGRRGGRGRRRPAFEATFDHGEEGYGLWLDPAIVDDPVYAEHWAGHRPITVTISSDQIVINRFSDEPADDRGGVSGRGSYQRCMTWAGTDLLSSTRNVCGEKVLPHPYSTGFDYRRMTKGRSSGETMPSLRASSSMVDSFLSERALAFSARFSLPSCCRCDFAALVALRCS